jgi:hypothetical protein
VSFLRTRAGRIGAGFRPDLRGNAYFWRMVRRKMLER